MESTLDLYYVILWTQARQESQDTVKIQIHSASWFSWKVKIWHQDYTWESHHHFSVVPQGLRTGTAHYETPGHLTSFTARTEKVVIFIWDHKLSKTCSFYILVEYNITQNYQIPGPIQLPSSSRHNCVLSRKVAYEQRLFLQLWWKAHGHLQPLQMCSKWSQEVRGQLRASIGGLWDGFSSATHLLPPWGQRTRNSPLFMFNHQIKPSDLHILETLSAPVLVF